MNHNDIASVKKKLKWKSNSVDEVNIINLIQFLIPAERISFFNELYRILKVGGKIQMITPHWCSARAYGDLAFVYPPVSEAWIHHLNKEWREANAPWGKSYKCDFDVSGGYGMHQAICSRNTEYQQHAIMFWKEAAQDLITTLVKK